MKSEERAHRTYTNVCNTSTSKYQYSFGKSNRFNPSNSKMYVFNTFYDLPSTFVKKGGVIGRAKRDFQTNPSTSGPAPDQYNPRPLSNSGKTIFAAGRDKCQTSSIFYNTTINYPGPGKYDPKTTSHRPKATITGKPAQSYSTISPGPKYNFEGTLLDRNKILSGQTKKGGIKIVLPINKSRLAKSEILQQKQSYSPTKADGYMTSNAKKSLGMSGVNATIGHQARFRPASAKVIVPGPGQYETFSDFIDN